MSLLFELLKNLHLVIVRYPVLYNGSMNTVLIREVHSSKRCHPRYPVLHNEQCHPLLPGQPAEGHQGAGGEECLAGDPSQEPADWEAKKEDIRETGAYLCPLYKTNTQDQWSQGSSPPLDTPIMCCPSNCPQTTSQSSIGSCVARPWCASWMTSQSHTYLAGGLVGPPAVLTIT